MQYDPIKKSLGIVFNKSPYFRIIFYKLLNLLLLRTWHIKREIRKWHKENKNNAAILDAGSGFGQYSYYLAKKNKNWNITGLDIKQEQIDDCNNFFKSLNLKNGNFKFADLTVFKEENTYNLILSVDVMEHIEDDKQVFKNFFESLTEKGLLLISTPSDLGGSDVHDDEESSFIGEHVRDGYNINDISEKLLNAGFKKVECKYSYGFWGSLSWKLSMKIPIKLLGTSKLFFIVIPFYYILIYPFSYCFNWIDVCFNNKKGTGLVVKAWK